MKFRGRGEREEIHRIHKRFEQNRDRKWARGRKKIEEERGRERRRRRGEMVREKKGGEG